MPAMSATRTNALLLVTLLFGQLLLISGSVQQARTSGVLRGWIAAVTAPVLSAAGAVGGSVAGVAGEASTLVAAHRRNRRLEREVAELRNELRRVRQASDENAKLRELLDMRENLAPRSVGASVVTSHLTGQEMLIVLDRGQRQGVRLDLPVVAWGGAVGRVVEVDATHALVRLLTDPNSGVAGIVQGSQAQGMVVGQGTDMLELLYIPRFSGVIHGDRVVTSGLEGVFPRGFGIGEVVEIQEMPDGSQTIRLRPEIDFRELTEVLILLESAGGELLSPGGVEPAR
jgi:rod shape-determining protein MreC